MSELTNDEVAAVALAIKRASGLTGPLHPDESPWRRFDDAVARAAIDTYNATPSHVQCTCWKREVITPRN